MYMLLCAYTLIHSAPSSLTSDQILHPSSGHSPHPPVSLAAPSTTTTTTSSSGSSRRERGQGQTGRSAAASRGGATGRSGGAVTGDALQQALANAFSSIQTPSRAAQVSTVPGQYSRGVVYKCIIILFCSQLSY